MEIVLFEEIWFKINNKKIFITIKILNNLKKH